MKKNMLVVGVASLLGLAAFTLLPAQEPSAIFQFKTGEAKGGVQIFARAVNGKTVTGAPYSAESVTETTQTLGDGNRIARTSSVKLYRDSQGRERTEEGGGEATRILISDPVLKANFTLNPQAHTAQKGPAIQIRRTDGQNEARLLELQIADLAARTTDTIFTRLDAASALPLPRTAPGSSEPTTEQLSPKTIEGVFANGTRTTVTIPAGQIGNQLPIQVVDEVWYSPDLQMNVMTRHSDPRTGEVVYQLKNISRGEPDASLFQVPADYKINEAGGGRGGRSGGIVP